MNAFKVVKDFERAVAEYTGAPYAVAVNSCTNALFLCLMWLKEQEQLPDAISIPKRTYASVPHQINHAGASVIFRDEDWSGIYQLAPTVVFDSARRFTSGMFNKVDIDCGFAGYPGSPFMCTSHHWNKILGIQQGGVILHRDHAADAWLRRARFDGRGEGVAPADDQFTIGWHMYMSPEIAAEGLVRLSHLPRHNADMPNDAYPDLSLQRVFS